MERLLVLKGIVVVVFGIWVRLIVRWILMYIKIMVLIWMIGLRS